MTARQFSPDLIAGLRESLKRAEGQASDQRRQAADSRVSVQRHMAAAAEQDAQAAQYRELLRVADPKRAAAYADPDQSANAREWSLRQARIAGAREVIDFLEAHPELPVDALRSFNIFPHLKDEIANEQAVDRFAGVMGVPSGREAPNRHYRAAKTFGPDGAVSLEAVTCGRTDTSWNEGDPFPDWWPTEQAVEAAQQLVAPADAEAEIAADGDGA
jgi:hypothetical protein